jgi:NADH-quinone oxidoreductase subunit L
MGMKTLYLLVPLAPLARRHPRRLLRQASSAAPGRTSSPSLGVAISFVLSVIIFQDVQAGHTFNGAVYTWMESGGLKLESAS